MKYYDNMRTFNGKVYSIDAGKYGSKREATAQAKRNRSRNLLSRVVHLSNGWYTYSRRG